MKKLLKFSLFSTIILLTVFILLPQANAATFKEGNNITISSGETINDDLYISGGNVTVNGTINGDLFVGGGAVTINGTIDGDLFVGGGSVNFNGTVNDSMRIAGGNISLNGEVAKSVIVFGGNIILGNDSDIGGDLVGAVGSLQIDGRVGRDVQVASGNVNILGSIGDDVKVFVDTLTLASSAEIEGNLTYTSENKIDKAGGASIEGYIKHKVPKEKAPEAIPSIVGIFFARVISSIWSFLALALVGIVVSFLAPHRMVVTGEKIKSEPWKSLGIGFLILFIVPIAIFIVFVTIIGIPLAIIASLGYAVSIYFTNIFVGFFVGNTIINFWKLEKEIWPGFLMLLGLAILALFRFIPFIGFLISIVVTFFGLGAMFLAELDIRKKAKEAGAA